MSDLLLAFYGDDFTGSTDAMDALSRAGIRTVLFLEPPQPEQLDQFPTTQVIGVAGTARSMTPDQMDDVLPSSFRALSELPVPLVQYKICSTFDSSPEIGSIGRAIDIARNVFDAESVPIFPAAPPLGRYVVFGNMFARDEDDIYRLDRHPTMRNHPVTPMDESDLRLHLSKQIDARMELVDIVAIQNGEIEATNQLEAKLAADPDVVFFDTLDAADLPTVGAVVWNHYADGVDDPAFVVGSSGLEYALAEHWKASGFCSGEPQFDPVEPVDRVIVVSGSVSPMTASQISAAVDAGFTGIRIDTADLIDPATATDETRRLRRETLEALRADESVVLYTAHGPHDDAIDAVKERAQTLDDSEHVGDRIGSQLGRVLRQILDGIRVDRVCVSGGDTCGTVVPHLDIYALESRFPLAPGSPLCRAHSRQAATDGLKIALKGGQLGSSDYFVRMRDGAKRWE